MWGKVLFKGCLIPLEAVRPMKTLIFCTVVTALKMLWGMKTLWGNEAVAIIISCAATT